MPTPCTNCGKKESVEINHKRFCANCGETLVTSQIAPQPKRAIQPAKIAHGSPKPKPRTPHLLDLRKDRAKATYRPAQSMHGERKSSHDTRQQATKTTPSLKPKKAQRHQARLVRASATPKHAAISKFASDRHTETTQTTTGSKVNARAMAPHQTYQVNKTDETKTAQAVKAKKVRRLKFKMPRNPLRKLRNRQPLSRRPNLVPAMAVAGIVLLLGGYITYLNVPTLGLRVAASRAGIDARLPSYKPAEYTFSGVTGYRPGQITLRFSSPRAEEYLDLTQRQTQWDPPTLLENYVVPKSAHYISFNQNGLTIYVYNGNNAAWINNGIFYTLEGSNELNQDQVLKMAASL